jgi:hypothetical protein
MKVRDQLQVLTNIGLSNVSPIPSGSKSTGECGIFKLFD